MTDTPLFADVAGDHHEHILAILTTPVPSAADICEQHPRQEEDG